MEDKYGKIKKKSNILFLFLFLFSKNALSTSGVLNRGYLYLLGVRNIKAGGTKHQSRGYEMRRQNNGYLKLQGSGPETLLSAGTGKWLIMFRETLPSQI